MTTFQRESSEWKEILQFKKAPWVINFVWKGLMSETTKKKRTCIGKIKGIKTIVFLLKQLMVLHDLANGTNEQTI